MFISSMARKNNHARSKSANDAKRLQRHFAEQHHLQHHLFSADKLPRTLSRASVSSGVLINGSREKIRIQDMKYQSNTDKTIHPLRRSFDIPPKAETLASSSIDYIPSKTLPNEGISQSYSPTEDVMIKKHRFQESFDRSARSLRDSLHSHQMAYSHSKDWHMDPVHRRTQSEVSPRILEQTRPIKTSAVTPTRYHSRDDIDYENDVGEYNISLFQQAEQNMILHKLRTATSQNSPYELELCRLRYEKLKLEEAYLLKLKCEAELERTRGPKPKWYELKTKAFTAEMEKHSNVMRNKHNWQELLEYRNQLQEITGE